MKKTIVAYLLILISGLFLPVRVLAQSPVRDIFSFDSIVYSNGTYDWNVEDVFLIPVHKKVQIEIREKSQFTNNFQRHLFQGGVVLIWGGGVYSELVYGPAFDQNGDASHEGFLETTWETEKFLLNARYTMGFYPIDDSWFLLANIGGAYHFAALYTLQMKYYLGFDSNEVWTHSWKMENFFNWNPYLTTNLSGVVGFTLNGDETVIPWEAGISAVFRITPKIRFSHLFNFVKPTETVWGIQNTLTLDISF